MVGGQLQQASAASEVYCKTLDAGDLGALAFHESMHHKMLTGHALHSQGGLASATVDKNTQLTSPNKEGMAKALTTKVTQWPDGFTKLVSRRQRRDSGDPLWYL